MWVEVFAAVVFVVFGVGAPEEAGVGLAVGVGYAVGPGWFGFDGARAELVLADDVVAGDFAAAESYQIIFRIVPDHGCNGAAAIAGAV